MSRPRKYKLVFWVKSADRAVGIIDRLWAVGELTREQRAAMVAKIDDKRLIAEQAKNKKFDFLFAQIRQFYGDNGTQSAKKEKGAHPC